MDPKLRSILVCPACHGELADGEFDGTVELVCGQCQRAYPVRDEIPVLLIDEARTAS